MNKAQRCEWIDIAKGLAIIFVVLGHSVQYYLCIDNYENHFLWKFIYSFHMPFFFILSGYVIGMKPVSLNIRVKVSRLLIPFVSWAMVNFMVMSILYGFSIERILNYIYTPSNGGLWYLWALFYIYTIHSIIEVFIRSRYLRILLYVCVEILLLFANDMVNGHFGIAEISKYFPYYIVGFYLGRFGFMQDVSYKHFLIPIIIGGGLLIINKLGYMTVFEFSKHITALTWSLVFLLLSRLIKNGIIGGCLQKLGTQTLGIYAIDTYIMVSIGMLINDFWFWPIAIIIDILFSYLISEQLQRFSLLSRVFLGTKQTF